jgi:heme exporter protein A
MENCGDQMSLMAITARDVVKIFDNREIFRGISFSLSSRSSLAITGRNGAGKSTLSKIIAGIMSPTGGFIECSAGKKRIPAEEYKRQIGFVAPYLNLYDEFTAIENLRILSSIRANTRQKGEMIKDALIYVGLWNRCDDPVGTFSSGMKQRLKYAFALLHQPSVLILDEPTCSMDEEGTSLVREVVKKQKENGILIIATNVKKEADWCDNELQLGI